MQAATGPGIDDRGWTEWIATNLLRGCSTDSMLQGMVRAGLGADPALAAIQRVADDPIFTAALRARRRHQKLLSVVGNMQSVWAADPRYAEIPRHQAIDAADFLARYVHAFRPAVLTGHARAWPALRNWRLDRLAARFGEELIEVQDGRNDDPRFEENSVAHKRPMRFGEFLAYAERTAWDNNAYLTANNGLLRQARFAGLLDDVGELPPLADRAALASAAHLWIGPAGTKTPLHHDTCMLFHTQIVGSKRWRLVSPLEWERMYNHNHVFSPVDLDAPDHQRYPDIAATRVLEAVIHPGETLFLPLGWWHQVCALEPSVSISYTGLTIPNRFEYVDPAMP
ncbi:cupin-like domain-containing protein [Roseateles sp. DAIF2]|uniref:cupin-like domain-containing protein n=1 Tax=Roseateles sp. DAIF2 TaxID=2714952 RepID=UPI0018A2638C|nr:cupin-like domain-containing protein [Roseateles sp. DAIF2]QPF71863.1 cupin-like domain-containing protein [Roseateles sp. DAIF2]